MTLQSYKSIPLNEDGTSPGGHYFFRTPTNSDFYDSILAEIGAAPVEAPPEGKVTLGAFEGIQAAAATVAAFSAIFSMFF